MSESVQKVKLGRGVVGKTTYVAIALMGVLAVIAARATSEDLLWVGGLSVATFLIYYFGSLLFAARNPAASLLEGAELLAWQQSEMAAKGVGAIQPSKAVTPSLDTLSIEGGSAGDPS